MVLQALDRVGMFVKFGLKRMLDAHSLVEVGPSKRLTAHILVQLDKDDSQELPLRHPAEALRLERGH